jgi:hypothetical protein
MGTKGKKKTTTSNKQAVLFFFFFFIQSGRGGKRENKQAVLVSCDKGLLLVENSLHTNKGYCTCIISIVLVYIGVP